MKGYIQPDRKMGVKRYVQTLTLEDNPELINRYRELHDANHHWSEIRAGIRAVGILEMEMYIAGSTVVMIVDAPADFDWDRAMTRLAKMPRQAEWEAFMAAMQGADPSAPATDKWHPMERMFYLYD